MNERPRPPAKRSQVPARRAPEPKPLTKAEQAAALCSQGWGNLAKLPEKQATMLFAALSEQFPDLGPVELVNGFELLGGTTIYDKGEFWLSRLASSDLIVEYPDPIRLEPGTELWDKWMGKQDPEVIVAAYLIRVGKVAIATGTIEPVEEIGYSSIDDTVLYSQMWVELPKAKTADEARKMAMALEYEGPPLIYGTHPRVPSPYWVDRTFKKDNVWKVRFQYLSGDFDGLAGKTARTRAARRCGKRALGLSIAASLEMAQRSFEIKKESVGLLRAAHAEDPYATPEEIQEKVTRPEEDVTQAGTPENKVRQLYGVAERKFEDNPHLVIKRMLADVRGLDVTKRAVLEKLNPHEMTLEEFQKVGEILDKMPEIKEVEEVAAVVEDQEKLDL